ncbi:hypothetical protein EYF80_034413 [Liparis tanakae]|uniref:Uncharacterized protein n=1 Tax=Liparis tanakae TaxID=230148 RepID=A0A4Z2GQ38_9TELE|nr:hypothetical protein EYF80_034413 [Liparis tanakae]
MGGFTSSILISTSNTAAKGSVTSTGLSSRSMLIDCSGGVMSNDKQGLCGLVIGAVTGVGVFVSRVHIVDEEFPPIVPASSLLRLDNVKACIFPRAVIRELAPALNLAPSLVQEPSASARLSSTSKVTVSVSCALVSVSPLRTWIFFTEGRRRRRVNGRRFTGVEAPVGTRHALEDQRLLGAVHPDLHVACRLHHHAVLHPPHFLRRLAELHLQPHFTLLLHETSQLRVAFWEQVAFTSFWTDSLLENADLASEGVMSFVVLLGVLDDEFPLSAFGDEGSSLVLGDLRFIFSPHDGGAGGRNLAAQLKISFEGRRHSHGAFGFVQKLGRFI